MRPRAGLLSKVGENLVVAKEKHIYQVFLVGWTRSTSRFLSVSNFLSALAHVG